MKRIAAVFTLALTLTASFAYAGSAMDDLNNVYQNTNAFDGGDGSTINTSPAAAE